MRGGDRAPCSVLRGAPVVRVAYSACAREAVRSIVPLSYRKIVAWPGRANAQPNGNAQRKDKRAGVSSRIRDCDTVIRPVVAVKRYLCTGCVL